MNEQSKKLINLFMRLEGLLHRHMAVAGRRKNFINPHRGQGRILSILKLKPEITQKELTYLLDMSKQALGELLSKLEKAGYITRKPSEEDRRVMIITLTEKGKAASGEMENDNEEVEDIFQCLTDEEKDKLSEYLERLVSELQNDRKFTGHRPKDFGDFEHFREERVQHGFEYFHGHENFRR